MSYNKKPRLSINEYVTGILAGNKVLLSKAITLVESDLPSDRMLADEIVSQIEPHSGKAIRIGITGVPGVGKSTFIESFGNHITSTGLKLAVLAIDPSSRKTKGSILGDKTRMETLSKNELAYIRPTSARNSLGGIAYNTREAMLLCEAAGFEVVIIETVGVGQSEVAVHELTDFFLLLMLAGAGDELQGIKKGIVEMADLIAITKADGNNVEEAKKASQDFKNALHFSSKGNGWEPKVVICSALENKGIIDIWELIKRFESISRSNGQWNTRRSVQHLAWLNNRIDYYLKSNFYNHQKVAKEIAGVKDKVLSGQLSAIEASNLLIKLFEGN